MSTAARLPATGAAIPADVVLDPAHARLLRLARQARTRLSAADADIPEVDLACYDALIEEAC